MDGQSGKDSSCEYFWVQEEHKPKDPEEGGWRMAYFARYIAHLCDDALHLLLNYGRQGRLGEALKQASSRDFDQRSLAIATKELSCIEILLTAEDQDRDPPLDWLTPFLRAGLKSLDKILPGSPVKEMLINQEQIANADLPDEGAKEACRALGLSLHAAQAEPFLKDFLSTSRAIRCELLKDALLEPIDVIKQRLQS